MVGKRACFAARFSRIEAYRRHEAILTVITPSDGLLGAHSARRQARSAHHGSSGIYRSPQRQAVAPQGHCGISQASNL